MFGEHFLPGLAGTVVFGIMGILMLLGGFKLFDWVLPKVDFQESMQANPIAAAIIVGSFFVALGMIVSSVVH